MKKTNFNLEISTEQLKGRVVESTLADLKDHSDIQPNAWYFII